MREIAATPTYEMQTERAMTFARDAYADDRENDNGLRHLVGGLAREDAKLDGERGWVSFLADDALIEAEVSEAPCGVLTIDAYLLRADDAIPAEQEVREWIDRQPEPPLGTLGFNSRGDTEDGQAVIGPVLSFDVKLDSTVAEFIKDLIFPFAEAWDGGMVAQVPEALYDRARRFYRFDPVEIEPRNAWLLKGDEVSFPTPGELARMQADGTRGVFDNLWTAPKNGELGDLALVYFQTPRKAAHFVARLASRPFWQTDVEVNAIEAVDLHQWWAYTTPLIEIEPIPYQALREAAGGYLNLKGRSGHYLPPKVIAALSFKAAHAEQQDELERVAQAPVGMAELPDQAELTFEEWRRIPSGLLPLEAKVSEYIVKPLETLLYGPGWEWTRTREPRIEPTLGPVVKPEYKVPSGFVDFVFEYGGPPVPALAVEVKLAVLRPSSGGWADSLDFRQLRRYMDALDVPGLLVDAQRLYLVKPGADAPYAEIVRAKATWGDIALIRDLLIDAERKRNPLKPRLALPRPRVARRS